MAQEYKVCYSVQTGRGAGNERFTWLPHSDEEQAKREISRAEGRPIMIYWISAELDERTNEHGSMD